MTTRTEMQPVAGARFFTWLALPLFLLAGCVSAPVSGTDQPVQVAVATPTPVAATDVTAQIQ